MESVRRGRADFASLFLLHGANVNSQDTDWNTALHLACEQVDVQQISLLLRESPQLELTNQKGETALSTLMAVDCFTRRHVSGPLSRATSLLTYAGASVWVGGRNLVHDAVKTRNADVVRSILSAANVENRSPQGLTPLQTATRHGAKLGIVKLLVEHGAAVNATAPGVGSALSFAASKCKLKVVEYLLKQRADTFLVHPTILASRGKSVEERSALELVAKFKERRYWELMLSMNMHANRAQNAQWEQPKRQKSGFESTDARSDKVACTWFELPELVIRLVARMLIDAETESRPTIQIRGPLHE
jgi:ankyrin repeat protein